MIKYKPYKSDKPNKKYYIITDDNKRFILVLVDVVILQFIKMKQENNYVLIGTRKMKIGINPKLIVRGSGVSGWYGIYKLLVFE